MLTLCSLQHNYHVSAPPIGPYQGESVDNFNWGVRRPSLTNLDGELIGGVEREARQQVFVYLYICIICICSITGSTGRKARAVTRSWAP